MAKKKKHKNTDLPVVMDYGIGCISVYDPIAMMPYSDPPITEQTRFKKLGKEMKAEFKWLAASLTMEHWNEKRQIPFGEEMSKLRTRLLRMFAEEYSILLKDDTELKNYLLTLVIFTINKSVTHLPSYGFFIYLNRKLCSAISAATDASGSRHPQYAPVRRRQSA